MGSATPVRPFGLDADDPFENDSPSARKTQFDSDLIAASTRDSPRQIKRVIESQLADTERKLQDTSRLGDTLLRQKLQLADTLRGFESTSPMREMDPNLRQKLVDLEKEVNKTGRDSKSLLHKGRRQSSDLRNLTGTPHTFSADAAPSPSKPQAFTKGRANQQASNTDLQLAADISNSLLTQVRSLQAALSDKEAALKRTNDENTSLHLEADAFRHRLQRLDDSEEKYKDENWALATQVQDLLAQAKDSADREQRLSQALNQSKAEKSNAEREYEELKASHNKLSDDHGVLKKQHDIDAASHRRNLATIDDDRDHMQRKIDELTDQNTQLARAVAVRLGPDIPILTPQQTLGSDDDYDGRRTPEQSAPPSPVKATPRHGHLESETLRSSLTHAQRMIQNLKNTIHREKTEKAELKRLLQDARDDLELSKQDLTFVAPGSRRRKPTAPNDSFKRFPRSDRLGAGKYENEWIEYDSPPVRGHQRQESDSTDAFETADERQSVGTDTEYHTGAENQPQDGSDTETEKGFSSSVRSDRSIKRISFQSTASDDDDLDKSPMTAQGSQRITPRQLKGLRESSMTPSKDSPLSFTSSSGRPFSDQNLAAELAGLDDSSSYGTNTPSRSIASADSSPTLLRRSLPSPFARETKVLVNTADAGTMTVTEQTPDGSETIAEENTTALPVQVESRPSVTLTMSSIQTLGTSPIAPVKIIKPTYSTSSTMMTPVRSSDNSTAMTPIRTANTSTQMTPVKTANMSTSMTPIRNVAQSTQMTPVQSTDHSTAMTPVRSTNQSTAMTPIRHADQSTSITPLPKAPQLLKPEMIDSSTNMTPVHMVDAASSAHKSSARSIKTTVTSRGSPLAKNEKSTPSRSSVSPLNPTAASVQTSTPEQSSFKILKHENNDGSFTEPTIHVADNEDQHIPFNLAVDTPDSVETPMLKRSEILDDEFVTPASAASKNDMTALPVTPTKSTGASRPSSQNSPASIRSKHSPSEQNYGPGASDSNLLLPTRRPGSSDSTRLRPTSSQSARLPPLPADHREVIAAAASRTSSMMNVAPPSIATIRPQETPNDYTARASSIHQSPVYRRSSVRHRAPSVAARSELTHKSSISSFASEVEHRFNMPPSEFDMNNPTTDPRMITAITQTMIGEYLWKYTRKTGRGEMSENRHRRFFWIHPYTRMLYWSDQDPTARGRPELKAKSVSIQAIRVVEDNNLLPTGLHTKSIIIVTPGRDIKFTAPTSQRHETWMNALSYLLLRHQADKTENAIAPALERNDTDVSINSEDIHEFNAGYQRSDSRLSRRSQTRYATATQWTQPTLAPRPSSAHANNNTRSASTVRRANNRRSLGHVATPDPARNYTDTSARAEVDADGFKKPAARVSLGPNGTIKQGDQQQSRLRNFTARLRAPSLATFTRRGRHARQSSEASAGSADAPAATSIQAAASSASLQIRENEQHTVTKTTVQRKRQSLGASVERYQMQNVRACCDGQHDVNDLHSNQPDLSRTASVSSRMSLRR